MAEKDKMNLIFEISGSDALHKFEAGRSPTLYFQSENKTVSEVSVKNCLLYCIISINRQMHVVELLFLLFLALHKINNCMNKTNKGTYDVLSKMHYLFRNAFLHL